MRLVVTIDHRFDRTPDGAIWSMTAFTYPFWTRYLTAFDEVRVVARLRQVETVAAHCTRSDGAGVCFAAIPYYHGPLEYVRRASQVTSAVQRALGPDDAVLLRINGQLSSCMEPLLRRTKRPYGVEVVGDPYDAFAPGYVSHPLRPFLRWWFPRRMRRQCAGACAAAYVTEQALQRRYPPGPHAFSTHYSSIVLQNEDFASEPWTPIEGQRAFTLIIVGTLDNLSKGPDTLLEALALEVRRGHDLSLKIVGGGKYQKHLQTRAAELNLDGRVDFVGWQPSGPGVRAQLRQADLFVLPSRQEGLSRATIEAMAQGLPCIATTVGGTGELLPYEDLVPPNDVPALAQKIHEVIAHPERMRRMAERNLNQAHEYHVDTLRPRWTAMYRYLRERTAMWLSQPTRKV